MKCKYLKCGHARSKHILHKSFDVNSWSMMCIMCPGYKEYHGFSTKAKKRK